MAEAERMRQNYSRKANWSRWGPYLAERQWGTIREDYSVDGNCWRYFTHDQARARAYRWGEDGLCGGLTDHQARVAFSLALWNGVDPILKERCFGLTNEEGNHGEDVKEHLFYLESTPMHTYMRTLYKYPHAYPYDELTAARPTVLDREFEIEDTAALDNYFDVETTMAKDSPDCVIIKVTVTNCGKEADCWLLPQLTCRNTWTWGQTYREESEWGKPHLSITDKGAILVEHRSLQEHVLSFKQPPEKLIFTENESNPRVFGLPREAGKVYKDGFHDFVIHRDDTSVSTAGGTKAAGVYHMEKMARNESRSVWLCLRAQSAREPADWSTVLRDRKAEADEFYDSVMSPGLTADERNIFIQAAAGLLFSKQFYYFDLRSWLNGDTEQPEPPETHKNGRNSKWAFHFFARDVLSMPDCWEYPWFAAWDLAFHAIALAEIDVEFAKQQLVLLTREWYMSPSGALPAYEFNFDDVNPPVHAYAVWKLYRKTQDLAGDKDKGDRRFLASSFHKLLINWTWWLNMKDPGGKNIFSGGFLGLDNISIFDRSQPLPNGAHLEQADGTSWIAFFCTSMFKIAVELAHYDVSYEDIASKFFEHFVAISSAINTFGGSGLFDDATGFYYDSVRCSDGTSKSIPLRSYVGIVPLFSLINVSSYVVDHMEGLRKRTLWFLSHRPELARSVKASRVDASKLAETAADLSVAPKQGPSGTLRSPRGRSKIQVYKEETVKHQQKKHDGKHSGEFSLFQLSIPSHRRLNSILSYLLDENEFLSPFGIRSLSRYHLDNPVVVELGGQIFRCEYAPGESTSKLFGGNSNWRGPLWFPMMFLVTESMERMAHFYTDDVREFPTGSGRRMPLSEIATQLWQRMVNLFLPDANGDRPCNGGHPLFRRPGWRDTLRFNEYFHGETGRGCGAQSQGWTFLVLVALNRVGDARTGATE